MRKFVLLAMATFSYFFSDGQSCAPIGITTDPAAPVNNQVPSKINSFNWTLQQWLINSIYSSPGNDQIISPFYQIDNSITNHFVTSLDMKPEDGWELIRRDLGYGDDNITPNNPKVDNPFLLLYNKYNGTLRVFIARGGDAPFNGARIILKFIAGSPIQTALLDLSGTLNAIQEPFIKDKFFQAVSEFNNEQFKWFYADFPMQYDPCTCFWTSKLVIQAYLINTSSITLNGSMNGTFTSIANGQGTINQPNSSFSFGDLVGAGKKASESYKSINDFTSKQKKAIDEFMKNKDPNKAQQKKDALTSLQNAIKNSSFLSAGLAAAPYIGAAVSLLDFFIGGGKKADPIEEVKLSPMAIDMTVKLNGTISASFLYKDITFWNPGSNNSAQNLSEYPYYNEVMGVFNLMEKPKLTVKTTIQNDHTTGYQTRRYKYWVNFPIKYAINPAAGLILQEAQAALIIEGDSILPVTPNGDFWDLEAKNVLTGKWQYRTQYENVNCFDQYVFEHIASTDPDQGPNWIPSAGVVYIKFLLNFKRANSSGPTQEVLLVAKYPISVVTTGTIPVYPPCSNGIFVPMPSSEISAYCGSDTYKLPHMQKRPGGTIDEVSAANNAFKVFPNPTSKTFGISFVATGTQKYSAYITNIAGLRVKELFKDQRLPGGAFQKQFDVSNLPAGIYNVVVSDGTIQKINKLIVVK